MTRLIVWRHGNTDWNAASRVQGQTDVPLNELGREQARAAAPLLAALRPDAIVSSDLRRAADTAAALAALTGLPVRADARLRERHFGQWQGLHLTEVAERFPDRVRPLAGRRPGSGRRHRDPATTSASGSAPRCGTRPTLAAGGTVVVATHGGGARQGVGHLLGWDHAVLRSRRLAGQLPLDRAAARRRPGLAAARRTTSAWSPPPAVADAV